MKTLLTILNRNKNRGSHKIYPYTNELSLPTSSSVVKKTNQCNGGTCLIYVFAYIVCNCIFCPICFLIWSPVFYYINVIINPHPTPSPTLAPAYTPGPGLHPTIYNSTN